MVDDFSDVIERARLHPEWAYGFLHCFEGVVWFLNQNKDDDVENVVETLANVLAVFKEHVA